MMEDPLGQSVGGALQECLRSVARSFTAGDQVQPCALLWPDPDRLWQTSAREVRKSMPELYMMGSYAPAEHSGPSLWLRCVEARTVSEAPPSDVTPVIYLPGVSRERLRDLENISTDLAPLAEIQYRGIVWLHVNGKEWTPLAFLMSDQGGLGLEVARDQASQLALLRALPQLLHERVEDLRGKVLNAEFFDDLVAPDAEGLILRWMNGPEEFVKHRSEPEWRAFCEQCKSDYRFDPEKDGPLKAAQLLAGRQNHWSRVWRRFAEAPANYKGVVECLRRAAPREPALFDTAEIWPTINDQKERDLAKDLAALVDKPQDEAIKRITVLEQEHGARRRYPWRVLGLCPFAVALESLSKIATRVEKTPGGPTPEAFAGLFVKEGWEVDAASLEAMAACTAPDLQVPVLGALRAIYLPWLDATARHLLQLLTPLGAAPPRRHSAPGLEAGRVVMFVDGLRFDVAKLLRDSLTEEGREAVLDWDWAPLPTVTATAKPYVSPLAGSLKKGEMSDEFAPTLENGQRFTQDRFVQALESAGWQVLEWNAVGDPSGAGWTEAGALDKRGHGEGWKLAHAVPNEVRDLSARVQALLNAGWTEVRVVTDHGWLLLALNLPKVELKSFLAEHRWGRCAAIKPGVSTGLPEFKWQWNEEVIVVSPPGAGCFRAGMEYSHGGISLQELVVPVLTVRKGDRRRSETRLKEAMWTGAKCRIVVQGTCHGLSVDVRARINDKDTSFLPDRQAKSVPMAGAVTVFLEDDGNIGKDAVIVLLDEAARESRQVIDSMPTTLGANT